MKDNTDRTKEMSIYQSECGINTVDVFHLIELQVKTINSQNRVIELLDEKAKLKEELRVEQADKEEHFQQYHSESCSSCGNSM
jgi:hypothetical protein|tara:strand:+ start:748 stop:996 length:249 start_codon:yes stop_codon:yes gene_type:complete